MKKTGIVVTGLPASGKTTVGRKIATNLAFQLLDKDDFLEKLYNTNVVKSWEDRKALSRKSDSLFTNSAKEKGSAVLVSHWKPTGAHAESGTPTDWLDGTYSTLIEIHCICPPWLAQKRFFTRNRHPSHLDAQRDPTDLAARFADLENGYPLGVGKVIEIRTDDNVNHEALANRIEQLLATSARDL